MRFSDILSQPLGTILEWGGLRSQPLTGALGRGLLSPPDLVVSASSPGQLNVRPGWADGFGQTISLDIPSSGDGIEEGLNLLKDILEGEDAPAICAFQPTGYPAGRRVSVDGEVRDLFDGVVHVWCGPVIDAGNAAADSLPDGARIRWRGNISDRIGGTPNGDAPIAIHQVVAGWRLRSGPSWEQTRASTVDTGQTIADVLGWGADHHRQVTGKRTVIPRFVIAADGTSRFELW